MQKASGGTQPFVEGMDNYSNLLHWTSGGRSARSSLVLPMDSAQAVKWCHIKEIMACVGCSEDELICAITQYPNITDAYGNDRHNPGPKVTRNKRRLLFALIIEKKTEHKPADLSDGEYWTDVEEIRECDVTNDDIVNGRWIPLEKDRIWKRVACLLVVKPVKQSFCDPCLVSYPLGNLQLMIDHTVQPTHFMRAGQAEALLSGKNAGKPAFGSRSIRHDARALSSQCNGIPREQ